MRGCLWPATATGSETMVEKAARIKPSGHLSPPADECGAAAAAGEGDPERRGDGVRGLTAAPILWLIPAIQGSWTALCSVMLPCRILVSPCESILEPCEPLWMIFAVLWAF